MNIDQKLTTKVAEMRNEMLDLFQHSDIGVDFEPLLRRFESTLPLIEDIKTEVSNIEKLLNNPQNQPEDQEDEKKKRPRDSNPLDDSNRYLPGPDDPTTSDLLPDLTNRVQEFNHLLKEYEKLDTPVPSGLWWVPVVIQGIDLAWRMKRYQDAYNANIQRKIDNATNSNKSFGESLKDDVKSDIQTFKEYVELFKQDMQDLLDDIRDQQGEDYRTTIEKLLELFNLDTSILHKTEDIKEDTEDIKADTTDIKSSVNDMDDNMSQCCSNMDSKLDRNHDDNVSIKGDTSEIKTLVETLQPTTQSNQSLATVTKLNAIQADLNYIRGLL